MLVSSTAEGEFILLLFPLTFHANLFSQFDSLPLYYTIYNIFKICFVSSTAKNSGHYRSSDAESDGVSEDENGEDHFGNDYPDELSSSGGEHGDDEDSSAY